ncbi:MAG: hypothetical protein K5770_19920 [Lachnospiraceae bacterium]|nr:hypothetical protein [Lachnospiraceae bacterium]
MEVIIMIVILITLFSFGYYAAGRFGIFCNDSKKNRRRPSPLDKKAGRMKKSK